MESVFVMLLIVGLAFLLSNSPYKLKTKQKEPAYVSYYNKLPDSSLEIAVEKIENGEFVPQFIGDEELTYILMEAGEREFLRENRSKNE